MILTLQQIACIINLLYAFNVPTSTILMVQQDLQPVISTTTPAQLSPSLTNSITQPVIQSTPMDQPAPTFAVKPHFANFTDEGFDVLWEADILSTATFSIGNTREGQWTVQTSFLEPTMTFQYGLPIRQGVLFYKATITANGQSVDSIGQLPS